jgi:hypothetical protein
MKKSWILYGIGILVIICLATLMLTIIPNQSQEIKTLTATLKDTNAEYDSSITKINSLENELANCKAANLNLQKPIEPKQAATTSTIKEPVSGDVGFYNMKGTGEYTQYPDKYLVWNLEDVQCAYLVKGMSASTRCTIISFITNNHPSLTLTNITLNGVPIEIAGGSPIKVSPQEKIALLRGVLMTRPIDYQITLGWRWE